MRFASHLLAIFKDEFRKDEERRRQSEEIISKYVFILIECCYDLDLILFYMRYLTEPKLFKALFARIFEKFTNENHYKKSAESLKTYAQKDYQGILSQIILDKTELKEFQINANNIINSLKVHNTSDKVIEELIKNMFDTVTTESLPHVLVLIRKLILSCKLDLAHSL